MLSEEIHVLLGLHQGSVLSPHLFDRIMDNNLKKWTFKLMCYLHKLFSKINSHPFQVGKEGGEEVGRGNEEFSSCSGSRDWN